MDGTYLPMSVVGVAGDLGSRPGRRVFYGNAKVEKLPQTGHLTGELERLITLPSGPPVSEME